MVNKSAPVKKAPEPISKKPKGKSSKNDDDEPYKASKSAKGKKEPVDENRVKRPLSAFFLFCNERRITLKQEEPSLMMGDQTKKMSAEWHNLDAKKKKKYEDLQAKEKERYEQ